MKKLALIGIAGVVAALTFAGTAAAKPTAGVAPLPAVVNLEQGQSQRLSSTDPVQQASGMTPAEYHALLVRSEALNRKYGLGTAALTLERGTNERFGSDNPIKLELVDSTPILSSDDGFAWDDAGIAVGVLLAAMGVATAGIVGVRHHGRLGTS
jgi:hypothetical protein